jgi:hypothetical protein
MPIKSLDSGKQLLVIPKRDEDLCVIPDGLLQNGERALTDLVLL